MDNVIRWLEQFQKLDELICAKENEIAKTIARATASTANLLSASATGKKSDKVGENGAELVLLRQKKEVLERKKEDLLETLQELPADEFGVLHREYVLGMKRKEIAHDMNYSSVTIWRIRKRARSLLKDILAEKGGGL